MINTLCVMICVFMFVAAIPVEARDLYDRDGRKMGSQDGNKFYDSSGRLEYTRDRDSDKDTYYDKSGRRQWIIDRDNHHKDHDD